MPITSKPAHRPPECEPLETRSLNSASPVALPAPSFSVDNGVLTINGTSGEDRVSIRTTAAGTYVRLTDDGSVRKRFSPDAINRIVFDGGGSRDRVNLDATSNVITYTRRVEGRVVNYTDGSQTNDYSVAVQPGSDLAGTAHWLRRYRRQRAALAGSTAKTVLIGDSITERFATDGQTQWQALKSRYDAADLGFAGDTTSSLLYRLRNGLLDGFWPKTIFVSVGTNNIGLTDSVRSTVRGIRRVLGTIHELRPKASIVLSSVLPRGKADEHAKTVDAVNDKLDDLAAEFDAVFADARKAFTVSDTTASDFRNNSIHLSQDGYAKWTPVVATGLSLARLQDSLDLNNVA